MGAWRYAFSSQKATINPKMSCAIPETLVWRE
jgi:hypothetical protein